MRKGEKVFLMVNLKNGGEYRITESKLKKEAGRWEMVEDAAGEPEITYKEIKERLDALDVDYKKNASKATLMTILELEEERL